MKSPANDRENSTWFIFQTNLILLIKSESGYQLLSTEDINGLSFSFVRQHRISRVNEPAIYSAELPSSFSLPPMIEAVPLRKALNILNIEWYQTLVKAYSILQWDTNHRFCGRCASPTSQRIDTFERSCPSCQLAVYPRISPSMIVLIHKQDQILMARSHHFAPGAYGLLAGFVEAGESVEDAVHREVKEEANIAVKNLRYFGSQAWPFPDSLMIGFIAEYASGELIIDPVEIEDAGWYRYDQLPGLPPLGVSIAHRMIRHHVAECQEKYAR